MSHVSRSTRHLMQHLRRTNDLPSFDIAQSNAIEPERAQGRYTAENYEGAGPPEREISLVFYGLEPASWRQVPEEW